MCCISSSRGAPVRAAGLGLAILLAIVLVHRPAAQTTPQPDVRALGEARLLAGPTDCGGQRCFTVEVRCPDLIGPDRALLKVGDPLASAPRGTILFTTGGGGTGLWEGFGPDATRVLGELRRAGFRTVQIRWLRAWLDGAAGAREGVGRLACRPATVARWIFDHLNRSNLP